MIWNIFGRYNSYWNFLSLKMITGWITQKYNFSIPLYLLSLDNTIATRILVSRAFHIYSHGIVLNLALEFEQASSSHFLPTIFPSVQCDVYLAMPKISYVRSFNNKRVEWTYTQLAYDFLLHRRKLMMSIYHEVRALYNFHSRRTDYWIHNSNTR